MSTALLAKRNDPVRNVFLCLKGRGTRLAFGWLASPVRNSQTKSQFILDFPLNDTDNWHFCYWFLDLCVFACSKPWSEMGLDFDMAA